METTMTQNLSKPEVMTGTPVRPRAAALPAADDAIRALRRFHLGLEEGRGEASYLPAALAGLRTASPEFPFLLYPADAGSLDLPSDRPLGMPFRAAVRHLLPDLSEADAERIVERAAAHPEGTWLAELPEALRAAVPAGSRLLGLDADLPLVLLRQAALRRYVPARGRLVLEAGEEARALHGLLDVDRTKKAEARGADGLSRAMGGMGEKLLDLSKLSGALGGHRGARALTTEREARIRLAFEALDRCADAPATHGCLLVHDGGFAPPAGWDAVEAGNPCQAAMDLFDERAALVGETLVAMRVARLERAEAYDASRHDPWLARFTWESMTEEEILLVPPVAVATTLERLLDGGMESFSRLLSSGRPVQVLLFDRPTHGASSSGRGFRLEPGYLGMSHREAVVSQVTAVRPGHMGETFRRALHAHRAAVHVVADPGTAAAGPYLELALASRAHPLWRYEPEGGASWARRFELGPNDDPAGEWMRREIRVIAEEGGEETLTMAVTYADLALLDPAHAEHFQRVPDGFPEADLVPVDAYLALDPETAAGKIPALWGVDPDGRLVRLAVSRVLARAAADRLGFWRTVQELAGVRNDYVEGAERRVRDDAESRAREELARNAQRHAEELARVEGAAMENVVRRLTASLLEIDPAVLTAPGSATLLETLRTGSVDDVARALLAAVEPETPAHPESQARVES